MWSFKFPSGLYFVALILVLATSLWHAGEVDAAVVVPGYDEYEFALCADDAYKTFNLSDHETTLRLDDCVEACTEDPECHLFSFSSIHEICKLFKEDGCQFQASPEFFPYMDIDFNAAYDTYHAVTCDFPPSLANGSPTATTFSYRISADYKCDPNYILTGNDTLTCLEDAEWSGEIPRCVYEDYFNCAVHCMFAEEFDLVNVTCPEGYVAYIIYANYGWDNESTCISQLGQLLLHVTGLSCKSGGPGKFSGDLCTLWNNETCLDSTINERIQYLCNGKSFCQFEVDIDSDLFASCHTCDTLTVPLLQLEYKCVQNFETSNETCEVNPMCETMAMNITNGELSIVYDKTGLSFQYSCDFGFTFDSGDDDGDNIILIACDVVGYPTEPPPSCSVVQCNSLNTTYATFQSVGNNFSDTGVITCTPGYEIHGVSSLLVNCTEFGNWSSEEDCTPVDCGVLVLMNANFNVQTGTEYLDRAVIVCNDGYEINNTNSMEVECLSTGSWSNTDDCEAKDCGQLSLTNATLSTPSGTTFPNSATINCNVGHELDGQNSKTISCTNTGSWSSEDDCTVVDCGPLVLSNAAFSAPSGTKYTAVATVTCNEGYEINGGSTNTISCQATGSWSSTSDCTPVDCGPLILQNAVFDAPSGTRYPNSATITCNDGYETAGMLTQQNINCQSSASWTFTDDCTAKDCDSLTVANGEFSAPDGTTFPNNATLSCDPGYEIDGKIVKTISCMDTGSWSSTPSCTVVNCGVRAVENGKLNVTEGTNFTNTATVVCNQGYEINGGQDQLDITCLASGDWTSMENCTAVDCGDAPAPPDDGSRSLTSTTFESTVTYTCNSGYLLKGNSEIQCQADKTWSGAAPECALLTEYVQTAVLTTDKDCDDFNENTLEVFLETSSDEVKAFVAEQIAKLPEKYRATATITIVGIRCASPLSIVLQVVLGSTESENDTISHLKTVLEESLGETVTIDGGNTQSITFVSINSTEKSVALYNCDPGYFIEINEESCFPCAKNTYQPNNIQELCLSCPAGTVTEREATTGNEEDVCKAVAAESNNSGLILGLSIGIPLGLLFAVSFVLGGCYICTRCFYHARKRPADMLPENLYQRRSRDHPVAYHNSHYYGFDPLRH